jgi:hypothetical protein
VYSIANQSIAIHHCFLTKLQQDMDGMDKISFTSQLTQALQKLPHTSDDVEGAAIIVQALDDVKAVLTSTFPHLTAQQQQVIK